MNENKISKEDLNNILKLYHLKKESIQIYITSPNKIKNHNIRKSFEKVLLFQNPFKIIKKYYLLYQKFKKIQIGSGEKYPGDGYLEKYLNHNKNLKNIVKLPSFEELKLNINKVFTENIITKNKKMNDIKKELDNEIINNIRNIKYKVKDNLNSNLQKSIKKELKEKIIKEIRDDFQNKLKKMPKKEQKILFKEEYNDSRAPFF